jgi:hypothetical protein
LVEDLRRLVGAHGVGWVHFRDMLFSPAHARRLSAAIIEHGLQVRWTCRARFEDGFTTDMLATMAQAGCAQIWFGLESASQRVLNLMEKGTRVESASRIIASCHSVGIGVHALVMHGFPTESEDEAQQTVAFLEERRDAIDSVTYTDFLLFAGTPVHKDPGRFGLTVFDRPDKPLQRDLAYATERPSTRASYAALKSRLDESFETGLLHPAHVSIFRSRRPARDPMSPGRQESAASPGGTTGPPPGQWRARTSWLGATWDIAALRDASAAPTRRNCVLVSQTGTAGFVQLDCAEPAHIGPTAGTVDDLIRVLGGRGVVRDGTPAPVVDGLRALSAAGYLAGDDNRSTT